MIIEVHSTSVDAACTVALPVYHARLVRGERVTYLCSWFTGCRNQYCETYSMILFTLFNALQWDQPLFSCHCLGRRGAPFHTKRRSFWQFVSKEQKCGFLGLICRFLLPVLLEQVTKNFFITCIHQSLSQEGQNHSRGRGWGWVSPLAPLKVCSL